MQHVHAWLRRLLWGWAFLVAASVVLGWVLGDWHTAWRVIQAIVLVVFGLAFVYLVVAGFVELRKDKPQD